MSINLRQILIPDRFQIVTSLVFSTIVLILLHRQIVWNKVLNILVVGDRQEIDTALDVTVWSQLDRLNQSEVLYYVVIGLFWLGVGLLAYLVLWVLSNLIIELYNKVLYEAYYWNHRRALSGLKILSRRILIAIAIISILIVTSVYGLPLWSYLFVQIFLESLTVWNGLALLLSIVGGAFNLYVLWVSYHIFRLTI